MTERKKYILEKLEAEGRVRVSDLSRDLGCTEATIRTAIRELETERKLIRTHGGAMRKDDDFKKYNGKNIYQHVEAKKSIAKKAWEYIGNSDTILIDDSTTSFYLALYIKDHPEKRVAVLTNSLASANELSGCSHVELYMIGGHIGGYLPAAMGDDTADFIRNIRVDEAFIGVHSVNFDVGLTSIATMQMRIKQAILQASKKVYVLADSSKFGGGFVSVICPISDAYQLITDNGISKDNLQKAKETGACLIVAD